MSLTAIFTRRPRKETPMTATTTTTDKPATDVLMRFLTQGGATVEITEDVWYSVRCLGCDYQKNNSSHIVYARSYANDHADACRAMPKPTA
ncbi:hypothetical protein ACFV27_37205 [Streptomyces antimycoticus]|uniref:hypothetical protein n=1 Tax=Streptomyces antimycoticus TaxID=68175 RepID=UPI00368C8BC2